MSRRALSLPLTTSDEEELKRILGSGVRPVRVVLRALALLRLSEGLTAPEVAPLVQLSAKTVREITHRYCRGGLQRALFEGPRPGKQRALDQNQRQQIVALACGPPPPGQARWTVRLLAEQAHKKKLAPGVGRETIRLLLRDHDLKPWRKKNVERASA